MSEERFLFGRETDEEKKRRWRCLAVSSSLCPFFLFSFFSSWQRRMLLTRSSCWRWRHPWGLHVVLQRLATRSLPTCSQSRVPPRYHTPRHYWVRPIVRPRLSSPSFLSPVASSLLSLHLALSFSLSPSLWVLLCTLLLGGMQWISKDLFCTFLVLFIWFPSLFSRCLSPVFSLRMSPRLSMSVSANLSPFYLAEHSSLTPISPLPPSVALFVSRLSCPAPASFCGHLEM